MTRAKIVIKGENGYKIVDGFMNGDSDWETLKSICNEAFKNQCDFVGQVVADIVKHFDFSPVFNITYKYIIDIENKTLTQYDVNLNWDKGTVRQGKQLEFKQY